MRIAANNRKLAFTRGAIMIVIAIIGLLAAIAVPNFIKARTKSQKTVCIKNLQMIDGAKEVWALEAKRHVSDPVVVADVNTYIKGGEPICPGSGKYEYNDLRTPPTCTVAGHTLSPGDASIPAGNPLGGGDAGGSGSGSGSGSSGSGSGSTGGSSGPGGGDTSGPSRN